MPELPDVEVFREYLNATALHKKIEKVHLTKERILKGVSRTTLSRRLKHREMAETSRHGKHLFVKLTDNGWLRLHFGMTGFLRYYKRDDKALSHVRVQIDFANGYCLAYDNPRLLGQVGITANPAEFIDNAALGPDALKDFDLERLKELASGGRGMLKSTLMSQKKIAGIGNVYSDEILFQAKINPRTEIADLGQSRLDTLHNAMQYVLKKAIECRADPQRMPAAFLIRHRKEDSHCPRCGGDIKKIKISGRTSYICPDCQKL